MAVIQRIRNRSGILIAVIIGMALFAFIVQDALTGGGGSNRNRMTVAVIDGNKVHIDELYNFQDIEENYKEFKGSNADDRQLREQAWQELVNHYVLETEMDKLGLTVSDAELTDIVSGNNPHPYMAQLFPNENGSLNRAQLTQFLSQVNTWPEGHRDKQLWLFIENSLEKERLANKYSSLVRKGMYATSIDAKHAYMQSNKSVNISYVQKRYTEIADSMVSVGDADLRAYYQKHLSEFEQAEETRSIRYALWEVVPSEKDYRDAESWIVDLLPEFKELSAEETEQYVKINNTDFVSPANNYAPGDLSADLDSFAFASEPGDIYGPYFEDNYYKAAKLAKIDYLPDSVKASHIVLQINQQNAQQVLAFADSLVNLAKEGYNFEELVEANSANPSNEGDLGWFKEGFMNQFFSDSCFYNNTGDVFLSQTNQGLHIVKIKKQSRPTKKVRVGILARKVTPGDATDQMYYDKASNFARENTTSSAFIASLENSAQIVSRTAQLRTTDMEVPGIPESRELIQWAFKNEEGTVSLKVIQIGNKYIVPALTKVQEEGVIPFEDAVIRFRHEVTKQKKAALLVAEVKQAKESSATLADIASTLGTSVRNAPNIKFNSSIPGIGSEPIVTGIALNMPESSISDVIEGENGVFVISVDAIFTPEEEPNLAQYQRTAENVYNMKSYSAYKTLQDLANIEDRRINFY